MDKIRPMTHQANENSKDSMSMENFASWTRLYDNTRSLCFRTVVASHYLTTCQSWLGGPWTQTARLWSSINANISLMGKSVGSAYSLSVALSIYGLNLANWQYKFGRVRAVMMLYLLRSAPSAPWMSRPLWPRPKVLHLICLASINHKCNFRISNQHYICMLLD